MADAIWTDEEIRSELKSIDAGDHDVSTWTANFIESIVYEYKGPLSDKQRAKAMEIIQKDSETP